VHDSETAEAQVSEHVPNQLWTIRDAAHYLRVPISAIYKMTARKARVRIPSVRISGRLRFRRADIDEWLELLTVSNVEVLRTVRHGSRKVCHGIDSQEEAPRRRDGLDAHTRHGP